MRYPVPRPNFRAGIPHHRVAAFGMLIATALFPLEFIQAQDAQTGTSVRISQIGRKNRIVFDSDPASSTPTATPQATVAPFASPAVSSTPKSALINPEDSLVSPSPSSTPLPTPSPTPSAAALEAARTPAPTASPAPVITYAAPTPELVPVPIATPESAPAAIATPAPAVAESSPTPAPAVEASATPSPVVAVVPPAPVLPVAVSTPLPKPEAAPVATPALAVSTPAPAALVAPVAPAAPAEVTSATPKPVSAPVPALQAPLPQTVVSSVAAASVPPAPVAPAPKSNPAPSARGAATNVNVVADNAKPDLAPAPGSPPPSESVTINLINKLVERGILTKDDAAGMIKQAQAEADVARQQAQADMFAIAQAAAAQSATDQAVLAAQSGTAPNSDNDVRVMYIPEPVKTQIKEDIKMELVTEAKKGGSFRIGPSPLMPEWVARVRPFFDLRLRYEGDFFPQGNDATGAFPNFNAINTGPPFDVTGNQFAPQNNVDQDRNRFRIRARFGAEFDVSRSVTMGLRVATGENNSPVTTNQTVGLANQSQGGNFSKYAIWLDRAYLRYEIGKDSDRNLSLIVGRFDNPFFSTQLIWDDDLGFDGMALQAKYEVVDGVTPFFNGGAFPVFNTDFNFSSNQPSKFASDDKYLFGTQLGIDVKAIKDWEFKFATAYYYFYNVEGKLSSPFTPQNASDAGDTDNSRPSFAQKGNTYFPIRDIVPDASNDFGAINQYQYYGLATKFQELAITGRIDYNGFEPVQISLIGEAVQNLAFNQSNINAIAVNNRGPADASLSNSIGQFDGSPLAWMLDLRVGTPLLAKAWDWNVTMGYRWIGSDSVVDGFNDSDFGLGGTNMKGFTVAGQLAVSPNIWFTLRWMGADSLAGPTSKVDIIQFDLNSKF